VQSDHTLLLEVDHPKANACRIAIEPFAELNARTYSHLSADSRAVEARAAGHDADRSSTRC
jgi:DNA excision repair protein ERCC-3